MLRPQFFLFLIKLVSTYECSIHGLLFWEPFCSLFISPLLSQYWLILQFRIPVYTLNTQESKLIPLSFKGTKGTLSTLYGSNKSFMPDIREYTLGKTIRKQSMEPSRYPTRFHQLIRDIIWTNSFIIFKSVKFSLYLFQWNIWIKICISVGMYIIFTLLWNVFLVNF